MDDKKLLETSAAKKVLFSSSSFAHLSTKNVTSARLPSFKPPRDLFLTGTCNTNSPFSLSCANKSYRKTYTPNIHVTRKKGSSDAVPSDLAQNFNQKNKDKGKKLPFNKRRNPNVVQTKGVFSEGVAPGKVKAFGTPSTERISVKSNMDKPTLNPTKKIQKTEEDSKLKSLLKDDYIDDPSYIPDITFIPNCLPMVYNVKPDNSGNLEKTFESLQVKTEKAESINELSHETPDIGSVFEAIHNPKMFLFEFPNLAKQKEDSSKKKKNFKKSSSDPEKEIDKSNCLSSLGEGFFGYLRLHENGKAFLVVGKTTIPLSIIRHNTRQDIMSVSIDTEAMKGEVISLGNIDSSFTCSANFFPNVS